VGREALALQGLPLNKLILTGESPRELQDLAGNAMTSTVVGAVTIAAIIAGKDALKRNILSRDPQPQTQSALQNPAIVVKTDSHYLDSDQPLAFEGTGEHTLQEIYDLAGQTGRKCHCEGLSQITTSKILVCKDCGHSACKDCGKIPVHDYKPSRLLSRSPPQNFQRVIQEYLPMRVVLKGLLETDFGSLVDKVKGQLSPGHPAIVESQLRQAGETELQFRTTKRSQWWTAIYESASTRLEVTINEERACWYLYGKVNPTAGANDPNRQLLENPIARMKVQGDDIFQGSWQVCMPTFDAFEINITGKGSKVPSWQNSLELDRFEKDEVYSHLKIEYNTCPKVPLDQEICGLYKALPNCGAACASLHIKIPEDEAALGSDVMQVAATLTQDSGRKFFFLDPHKTGLPTDDRYVFSTDARRLEYQEQRPLVARLTSAWDPIAEGVTTVECEAKGEWVSCDASLRAFEGSERATYAMPRNDLALELFRKVSLDPLHPETLSYDCRTSAVVLLSFNVPLGNLVQHGTAEWWHSGDWQTVNAIDEREALQLDAWLIERPRGLAGFSKNLRMVALPQHLETCECCAPRLATTRWRLSKSGKIIPYEDGPEAGRYEQALKARPLPFIIRQRLKQGSHAQLQMAPNVSTLAHRAYGKLGDLSPDSRPSGFWGVNTHVELHPGNIFPQIKIKDTKELPKEEYEFPMNKLPKKELPKRLRPEQKRLLKWMIGQELEDAAPWKEQEVEEVAIPSLGWRVEYRARKETSVPGGVLADHVGFGKTPTILALHDKMKPVTDEEAKKPCDGSISLKATLVLVPPQLVNQWRDEIIKFLGYEYKILIVEGLKDLNKTTIADFESADFVIVSVDLLKSDSYWPKVALFANQPEGPSVGGRAFNVWHARVRAEIRKNVEELKKMTTPSKLAEFRQNLRAALRLAEKDENLLRLVPSKLTRGAKYEPYKGGSADQEMAADKIGEDGDAKNEDAEDETINTKCAEKKIAKDEATGDEGTRAEIGKAKAGKAKAGKAKARKPKKAEQPPLTEEEERQAKIDRSYNAMFGLKETNGTNSTDPDIEAWKQMRCPSLEMFTFARMVIDEYTYILQKYYDLFRAIKAHRKWTLSGTPPLAGFPDIRRMAGLVDANLGVLDDNAGEVQHATLASTRNERSDAETFQAFGFSHTPDWHGTRHQHAQRFVDQFVRQNAREIGELSVEYIIIPVRMYTTERIVYEELQHLLEDTDFEVGRGIQTQGQGDRGEQAGNLLKGCKSAPEALLKASSYFGKEVFKLTAENSNNLSDLERKGEIDLNNFSYIAFAGHLRHAVWLDKQIQRFWNDPKFEGMVESYGNLFEDWIISVQSGRSFHVAVTLEMLMKMAKDKYKFDHEEQFYRDEPDEAAKKKEKQEIRSKKAAAARAVKKAATDRIVYPGGGATEGKSIEPAVRHLPYKIPHDNLPQFIKALQSVIRQLQKDTGEVVSRYGKMRFARIARTLVARSKLDEPDKGVKRFDIDPCEVCGSSRNLSRLFINASCGHIICDSCLQKHRHIEHCVVKNCHVPAPRSRLRSLDDFEDTGEEDCEYGIKVDQIIALIQSIDDEDQVLLFVQYEELMNKLNDALNDKKIPHSGLFENKRSQAGRIVEKFKKNKEASRDKVLLLNSSNDTAAGA